MASLLKRFDCGHSAGGGPGRWNLTDPGPVQMNHRNLVKATCAKNSAVAKTRLRLTNIRLSPDFTTIYIEVRDHSLRLQSVFEEAEPTGVCKLADPAW